MGTFYIGLSMAGTVSGGTYTAGCLMELDKRLKKWRKAVKEKQPVTLKAIKDAGGYKAGDTIELGADEIPNHDVKIKSLTGASGGGVSGALYLISLAKNDQDTFLRKKWMSFTIEKMLNTSDLDKGELKSILNVLPIDDIAKELLKLTWDELNHLKDIDYIEDVVELYQTLSSYEPIPYQLVNAQNKTEDYGIFSNHFDYIRFGFAKDVNDANEDGVSPLRHLLTVKQGGKLKDDEAWLKLIKSTPATGAFPFAFKPREIERTAKEYKGKLFYLKHSLPGAKADYDTVYPHWTIDENDNTPFNLSYFDGGAFNREPHDLARASLLRFLQKKNLPLNKFKFKDQEILQLPNSGDEVYASVILIDPFPSEEERFKPGSKVESPPALLQQPGKLITALMNQGRYHSDWVEKVNNEDYYSRFILSPSKNKKSNKYNLAGEPFEAFGGFISSRFREHDYQLGHYNTYWFLSHHFAVPPDKNTTVTYCQNKSEATLNKYRALGWLFEEEVHGVKKTFCQIIPSFNTEDELNSTLPDWPKMTRFEWVQVRTQVFERVRGVIENGINKGRIVNWFIWKLAGKKKVEDLLDYMEKTLIAAKLLEK